MPKLGQKKTGGWLFLLAVLITAAACAPAPQNTPTPAPSDTPSPSATAPPSAIPTRTKKPSRTPAPTPTIPAIPEASCVPLDGERVSARVLTIVDGDTIDVFVNGLTFRVRYLGLDTPETRKAGTPVQRFGPEASKRNAELVRGQHVVLVADTIDRNQDDYGRLLRYVFAGDTFVNYALIREGYARLYLSEHSCGETFFEAYESADRDNIGMFAPTLTPTAVP